MRTNQELKVLRNRNLSVIHGFLVPRLATGAVRAMAAFHILNHWFLYGFPGSREFGELFGLSCDEQRKEMVIALRHQYGLEEIGSAEKLAKALVAKASLPVVSDNATGQKKPYAEEIVAALAAG